MNAQRSKPYKLAVSNQKGGVAKSTTTLNVAGALADRGGRVLAVDLDPQGYLTSALGLDDEYTAPTPNLYSALDDPDAHTVPNLTVSHDEFDVLPANIDMFNLQRELVSAIQGEMRLSRLFDGLDSYEYVVVDCPPSLGVLADNALLACGNVLIPAEAEDTSMRALDLLFNQIDTLERNFNASIEEQAIVVSNVDYPIDGEQAAMLEWFADSFGEHIPVYEVRNRAAIKRAWNAGASIVGHDESCDQESEFERIAAHIERLRTRVSA